MGEVLSSCLPDPATEKWILQANASIAEPCKFYLPAHVDPSQQFCNVGGSLPDNGFGFIQLLVLSGGYGYMLFFASNMIAEGAELLLLVPSMAGIVGSVVLPVLGAVPDGAIVLFSGMGPNAQEELKVGVGALAGSTIMLLTLPWYLATLGGRVDLVKSPSAAAAAAGGYLASYSKGVGERSTVGACDMFATGVQVTDAVKTSGLAMLIVSVSYLVIQVPALIVSGGHDPSDPSTAVQQSEAEKIWALFGMIISVLFFLAYLAYNVYYNDTEEKVLAVQLNAVKSGNISVSALFYNEFKKAIKEKGANKYALRYDQARLDKFLATFFKRYDRNGDGRIDQEELSSLLSDMGESQLGNEGINHADMDANQDGKIDFDEFKTSMTRLVHRKSVSSTPGSSRRGSLAPYQRGRRSTGGSRMQRQGSSGVTRGLQGTALKLAAAHSRGNSTSSGLITADLGEAERGLAPVNEDMRGSQMNLKPASLLSATHSAARGNEALEPLLDSADVTNVEESAEDDEEEEMPEEFADLPPEEQQRRILMRSAYYLFIGSALVLIFSDPMVGALSALGDRLKVDAFYISFVLAPMASNASELISSYNLALKKTKKTITISYSTLLGAAVMNATFCLAIFLALVYFQGLVWTFTAETLSIILVTIVMYMMSRKVTHTLFDATVVFALFPLSIAFVYVMENVAKLN